MRVATEYEEWLAAHEAVDPGGRGEAGDVVLQLYTSGTTGVPKGVLTTHRNLAACAETSPYWQFDAETVSATPLPMFHIGGIGWTFLGLWNGATTILVREFVPEAVLDLLEHERVTNGIFVPTMLQMLTAVPGAERRDYSALRSIAYGASPITTPVLTAALRTFRCSLYGVYGLTETHGRRRAARPGGPRPGRAQRAPAPVCGEATAVGGAADRRPRDRRRARAAGGRGGLAAGSQRDARGTSGARRRPRRR